MENDTVLAITKGQLIEINRSLNDYIHLRNYNRVLQMDLRVSDSLVNYWKGVSSSNAELYRLGELRRETEKDYFQKSLSAQKRKSRKTNIRMGVGGVLFGLLLGVLL